MLALFAEVDAILAPATPCTAPAIGQQTFTLDGVELTVRANLGIYTQPISFIGLPVVAVPVPLKPLPIGVQVIAAPWREDIALRIAYALEQAGVVGAGKPSLAGSKKKGARQMIGTLGRVGKGARHDAGPDRRSRVAPCPRVGGHASHPAHAWARRACSVE